MSELEITIYERLKLGELTFNQICNYFVNYKSEKVVFCNDVGKAVCRLISSGLIERDGRPAKYRVK